MKLFCNYLEKNHYYFLKLCEKYQKKAELSILETHDYEEEPIIYASMQNPVIEKTNTCNNNWYVVMTLKNQIFQENETETYQSAAVRQI